MYAINILQILITANVVLILGFTFYKPTLQIKKNQNSAAPHLIDK